MIYFIIYMAPGQAAAGNPAGSHIETRALKVQYSAGGAPPAGQRLE